MIELIEDKRGLVASYLSETQGTEWVGQALRTSGSVTFSKIFTFKREDLIAEPTEAQDDGGFEYKFRFAKRDASYYRVPGRVLRIRNDVLIATDGIRLTRRLFVAERNISIFRRMAEVVGAGEIAIGGDRRGNIPVVVFEELLKKFPNSTELDRYANARVSSIIGEYFDGMKDLRAQYEAYLSRNKSVREGRTRFKPKELLDTEINKFIWIRDTLRQWLAATDCRTEREWQQMLLEFILLIFPKYIAVLENVKIEDRYSKRGAVRDRFIDLALIDANGNLDVIEIKRPSHDLLLSKSQYRDNFVPTKDLSGTVMQAEKYLFHLSKWGIAGEIKLTKRYAHELPLGMSIRITNPKALIILGRDQDENGAPALDENQTFDLEVIKRKYANMMDILTYDDLLRRLDRIIEALHRKAANT